MTLEIGPEAPFILHALAAAALFLHIGGASLAMVAGGLAMFSKKGSQLHRQAGTVFVLAMLTMAGIAAIVAPMLAEPLEDRWTNTVAAIFVLYLTISGWMTVRRPVGGAGHLERWVMIVPIGIAVVSLGMAVTGTGYPILYVFGLVSALAVVCDARMIFRGRLIGVQRVSRHVWRMSAALFVATGSFFFGQADVLPPALRASVVPTILGLAPLVLMAFWLVRVRIGRRFNPRAIV